MHSRSSCLTRSRNARALWSFEIRASCAPAAHFSGVKEKSIPCKSRTSTIYQEECEHVSVVNSGAVSGICGDLPEILTVASFFERLSIRNKHLACVSARVCAAAAGVAAAASAAIAQDRHDAPAPGA